MRTKNYAGQTGRWQRRAVMSGAEEAEVGDPFYLSLRRFVRPEDRPAGRRPNPVEAFGRPPDPGAVPWDGGTSAVGAVTANSTFRGCALTVVQRE